VAMPAVIAGVVAAGLSGAADAEGAVASRLPQQFAYLLRDSRAAWRQFTYFEAAAGFVALAARDASRTGDDLWTSCRRLLGRWRDAGRDLRRSVRRGRVDLDIYAAADGADADAPLVLIVPGGAWAHGDDARLYRLLASAISKRSGGEAVVAQYEPWPLRDGPAMVADVADTLAWAEDRAPRRVVVVGLSAGAHLVAAAAARAPRPAAVALCSGVFDLEAHYAHERSRGVHDVSALGAAFEGSMRELSPAASAAAAPADRVLVIHGDRDRIAPASSGADAFCDALRAGGADVRRLDVPEPGHLDYAFRAMYDEQAPFLGWVTDLVDEVRAAR